MPIHTAKFFSEVHVCFNLFLIFVLLAMPVFQVRGGLFLGSFTGVMRYPRRSVIYQTAGGFFKLDRTEW